MDMDKYPLVSICIAFCLGILVAACLKIPFFVFWLLTFLFLIFSIIFIKQNIKFNIFILCATLFLGAALLRNSQVLPNYHIAKFTPYKGKSVCLTGVIDNDPVYKKRSISFTLKAEELKIDKTWQKTCGKVLVRVFKKNTFSYGDKLLLEGKLYQPFSFSREFNYKDYLKHQGIYSILSVKKDSVVKQLGRNVSNPLKAFAFRIRHRMNDVIIKNLSSFSAGILNALILGERQNLSPHVRDALVKSGSVHIIAISGLHLGIVAFIALVVLKIIRIPMKPRYILTILLLIIYCILTGARAPVVRATIMAVILLFGYFLERDVNIYNSLSLAALIILAVNPWQLFEVSFQLSFLSVIFIVWLTPKIKSVFPARLYKVTWMRFLILTFSVSTAAWFGLLPLIVYYFKIITPISVLANMVIVPYIFIIIASGFTLALVGVLIPPLAFIFAASSELFITILFKINSLFIAIPGAYFKLPRLSVAYVLLYYALFLTIFNFSKLSFMINYVKGNLVQGGDEKR